MTRVMEKRELIRCFDREESAAAKMVEITVDLLSPVVFLKGGLPIGGFVGEFVRKPCLDQWVGCLEVVFNLGT